MLRRLKNSVVAPRKKTSNIYPFLSSDFLPPPPLIDAYIPSSSNLGPGTVVTMTEDEVEVEVEDPIEEPAQQPESLGA
jgi:hypothetical protein